MTKLEILEKKLAEKKEKAAELRGEKVSLTKQLTEEGCKDITSAEKEADKEERQAAKLQEEFDQKVNELETEYDWS